MICEELKSKKNFIEEDFIELKNSVEEIIKIFEKYKDMRKNSKGYIEEMKRFLKKILYKITEKVIYHMI